MNWFGFGFNGFGQIIPTDVKCKVSTPVLLSDACGSDCRVSGSWSSRAAVIHTDGEKKPSVSSLMDVSTTMFLTSICCISMLYCNIILINFLFFSFFSYVFTIFQIYVRDASQTRS